MHHISNNLTSSSGLPSRKTHANILVTYFFCIRLSFNYLLSCGKKDTMKLALSRSYFSSVICPYFSLILSSTALSSWCFYRSTISKSRGDCSSLCNGVSCFPLDYSCLSAKLSSLFSDSLLRNHIFLRHSSSSRHLCYFRGKNQPLTYAIVFLNFFSRLCLCYCWLI